MWGRGVGGRISLKDFNYNCLNPSHLEIRKTDTVRLNKFFQTELVKRNFSFSSNVCIALNISSQYQEALSTYFIVPLLCAKKGKKKLFVTVYF